MPRGLRGVPGALVVLVVASATVRAILAWSLVPGWIAPDESTYMEAARGIVASGSPTYLGHSAGLHAFAYPLLLAPFTLIGDVQVATHMVGVLQAVVMSATAIPVFLWGRRFMPERNAFLAAVLTVLLPDLAYARLFMTQTLLYPLVVCALWATASVIEQPTTRRQFVLVVALAAALLTSLQAAVVLLAVPFAVGLMALFERRRPSLWAYLPLIAPFVVGAALVLAVLVGAGRERLLGAYAVVLGRYSVAAVVKYLGADLAGLTLVAGFVPALALLALLTRPRRLVAESRAAAAFAATAAGALVFALLQVAAFSSRFATGLLMERYYFAYAPLLFLALAYWLQRPRATSRVVTAAVLLAAVLFALPGDVIRGTGSWDAPALVPWSHIHGAALPAWTLLALGITVLAAVLLLTHRPVLVAAIPVVLLAVGSASASRALHRNQAEDMARTLGSPPSWVDDRTGGDPTAIVYTGDMWGESAARLIFWNPSIKHVYALGASMTGPVPLGPIGVGTDGNVTGMSSWIKYVVSSDSVAWYGVPVAEKRRPHLRLWLLFGAPRLSYWIVGPNERSILGGSASVDVYGCTGRSLRLHVLPFNRRTVLTVRLSDTRRETLKLPLGRKWRQTIPLPQVPGHCSAIVTVNHKAQTRIQILGRPPGG